MKINNIFKLIIAIVVCEGAGIFGAFFTTPAIQSGWYATLAKPVLAPPNWIFGPVWTTLFALMGISVWLIWEKLDSGPGLRRGGASSRNDRGASGNDRAIKIAIGIFSGQLILNTLWSIIFFGLHSPGGAFVEIIFLWFAILVTIVKFFKISKPAAWLLVPYIFWVSFAAYLNFSIWMLN